VQDLPDFAYVRNVTVLPTGEVYSACVFDAASDVAGYQILRTSYPTGLFDTLYTGLISPGVDELWFNDYTVKTWEQSYTYKYVLIDKCNNPSRVSNPGRSILLQGVAMDGFVNKLQWNTYGDWDAGVGKYRLFRSIDGGSTYSNIWTSDADTAHLDVVSADVDSLMEFCYYVEAVESQVNSYGIRDTSRSNSVCVIQKPTLWIPSAFRPGNLAGNNSFKAQGLYEKLATNHAFLIFNRWGELLFATADPTEGWDGTYQSSIAPSGIYVYQLKFNLPDGSSVLRRGSVMLLD
jgi:gliding motility-associated-like protein